MQYNIYIYIYGRFSLANCRRLYQSLISLPFAKRPAARGTAESTSGESKSHIPGQFTWGPRWIAIEKP